MAADVHSSGIYGNSGQFFRFFKHCLINGIFYTMKAAKKTKKRPIINMIVIIGRLTAAIGLRLKQLSVR
jgi:hypothetical protein